MDDFERLVKRYESDGFQFQTRTTDWGKRLIGTRKGGGKQSGGLGALLDFVATTQKMMIGYFDSGNPTPELFQGFLKEAEKFYDDNQESSKITTILIVTPTKLEKKPLTYLLEHSDERVVDLLDYKPLVSGRATEAEPKPSPLVRPAPTTSTVVTTLDYESMNRALPSPTERERVLCAWEFLPDQQPVTSQHFLVATQERGILMHKAGPDFVPDQSFKWEDCGQPRTDVDPGGPVLRLYDGSREHRLRNTDARFIEAMIHHLKYAREGYISNHMVELGFDAELRERCQADFVAGRYSLAVRNAFTLLETRIRHESLAPRDKSGVDLAIHAFEPQNGKIPVGLSESEREGTYLLFRGAFIAFRNPAAHNDQLVGLDRDGAFRQLALVDLLLTLTQKGKEQFQRGVP
jgi:uncharacterized protein (TIGR02391 family)